MTQPAKKPASTAQASAKMASNMTSKVASGAYSAAESTKAAAQNVVNIGAGAMRDMLSSGSGEAQKAQEKMWEMSRESMENFARGCDMFSKMCMEMMNISRGNMEAMIESCTITSNIAKGMTTEMSEMCNKSFSDCVEMSKEAFSCRTINDVVELQNKAVKQALDTCFNETNKICGMAFECASDALEPINERVSEASEQMCKVMAA
jgi:phasin family protein